MSIAAGIGPEIRPLIEQNTPQSQSRLEKMLPYLKTAALVTIYVLGIFGTIALPTTVGGAPGAVLGILTLVVTAWSEFLLSLAWAPKTTEYFISKLGGTSGRIGIAVCGPFFPLYEAYKYRHKKPEPPTTQIEI